MFDAPPEEQIPQILLRKPRPGQADWTPELLAEMSRLWAKGKTAQQVADALGNNVTRNAVIGKLHRLKIPRRDGRVRVPQPSTRAGRKAKGPDRRRENGGFMMAVSKAKIATMRKDASIILKPSAPPPEGSKTFMEVGLHDCRAIYGDARDLDTMRYCGLPVFRDGASYCLAHQKVHYRPAPINPNNMTWLGFRR